MNNYITIPLSKRGKNKDKYKALVSLEDAEYVMQFNWSVRKYKHIRYAVRRNSLTIDGKITYCHLHRTILARKLGRELLPHEFVDHIDGDGLNNRRENLRLATKAQNAHNVGKHSDSKSGYKGVSWNKGAHKWRVQIRVNGRRKHIGYFDTPEDAYEAYCKAAIEYHGEFARLE